MFVSQCWFSLLKPRFTHLDVSLSTGQSIVLVMRTLDGSSTLLAEVLAVAGVLLSEVEKGLNRTLVVLVTLDLDDHLLQTPDGLLAALLRHLALKVVVQLVAASTSLFLVLLGDLL